MTTFALDGTDGLVAYLAERLPERGHRVVARTAAIDAFVRVTDPTREPFATHVDEIVTAARTLRRGAVVISVVTRHASKTSAKYKQAAKDACVHHGVEEVRSVGIVTGEVRDPTTTGMNPIAHALHEQLFGGTLDPECVVLAIEVAAVRDVVLDGGVTLDSVALDSTCVTASDLTPWLRAGAGAIRDGFVRVDTRTRLRARALAEALVENGSAVRADAMTTAAALVGDALAAHIGDLRPNDFEDGRNLDDPDDWFAGWVAAINAALDEAHAKSRIREARRAWIVDDTTVAFTSAREWAICASACTTRA